MAVSSSASRLVSFDASSTVSNLAISGIQSGTNMPADAGAAT
jgi:hypothetical protein